MVYQVAAVCDGRGANQQVYREPEPRCYIASDDELQQHHPETVSRPRRKATKQSNNPEASRFFAGLRRSMEGPRMDTDGHGSKAKRECPSRGVEVTHGARDIEALF